MTIQIASIDAGTTTAIAIAELRLHHRTANLVRKALVSTEDVYEVIELVDINKCDFVVVERKAANGSNAGIEPYERIMGGLISKGYNTHNKFIFVHGHIITISPGIWKPYMKVQQIDLGRWQPQDSHQNDAMQMLFYAVQLNYTTKKVRYV